MFFLPVRRAAQTFGVRVAELCGFRARGWRRIRNVRLWPRGEDQFPDLAGVLTARSYRVGMPTVRHDGVRIHYELTGEGRPLVLIGGLGVHTGEYRPLIDALAGRHRVLAADNRGAGLSDKPDVPYSYSVMAADTLAAMDDADIAAADIAGFSMGARIAIELVLTVSHRAGTLTLIAGRPHGASRRRMRLLAKFAIAADRTGGSGLRRQLDAGKDYDIRARLKTLNIPTLVLHGRRDHIVPVADSLELASLIAGAELHLMPGGHLGVLRGRAGAYAARIDAFTAHSR
jgi:3-oxoadipate enol-lactonase